MIPIIPIKEARERALHRPSFDAVELSERARQGIRSIFGEDLTAPEVVQYIIDDVRARQDEAVREWMQRIDQVELEEFEVPPEAFARAREEVSPELDEAMQVSIDRLRRFHEEQRRRHCQSWQGDDGLGQLVIPLDRVGVYVPGGLAPLFSSLIHCVVPAMVAGVKEILIAIPPDREGNLHPAMLRAVERLGAGRIVRLGGAQAIAALAYGTETIPRVDKIVGPGNIFVILAKKAVFGDVDIDQLPGPTETLVVADHSANPKWTALDLMAQAEHDPMARPLLVTTSREFARNVQLEVEMELADAARRDIIELSIANQGFITVAETLDEALDFANIVAPEHLCLSVENAGDYINKIRHAGGIFVGEYCMEALGDYLAGPTHVMPTNRTARYSSPLNVWDFVKITSLFNLRKEEVQCLAETAALLADAEQLDCHAKALRARKKN